MRISDWSSDVCSSDLNIQCGDERVSAVPHGCGEAGEIALLPQCPVRVDRRICHGQNLSFSKATVQFVASRHSLAIASTCRLSVTQPPTRTCIWGWGARRDRKSVGQGKRVSGRVDIGCWGSIKKKK